MRNSLKYVFAAAVAALPVLAPPTGAGAKTLPPAFGTELGPDKAEADPRSSETEEMIQEKAERAERKARRAQRPQGRGKRGAKVHIQLDGDEEGGGGGIDGDLDGGVGADF